MTRALELSVFHVKYFEKVNFSVDGLEISIKSF